LTDIALQAQTRTGTTAVRPHLDRGFDPHTVIIFLGLLDSLYADVNASCAKTTTFLSYLLLFVALLIALGFESVNGFDDAANAGHGDRLRG
jgi:inorganic phosphate transporter, PiT family